MKKYAKVIFAKGGEESAILQRSLTEQLAVCHIITIDRMTVERWFEEDKKSFGGATHNIVLHNKKEVALFEEIMGSEPFRVPWIHWKIFKYPSGKSFKEWTAAMQEEEDGECETM